MGLARRAQGARRRRCRGTSLTTSNAEIVRNPHAPVGFRAARASAALALLDMCIDIACVAPPCIYPRRSKRGPPNTRTGSSSAFRAKFSTTQHAFPTSMGNPLFVQIAELDMPGFSQVFHSGVYVSLWDLERMRTRKSARVKP